MGLRDELEEEVGKIFRSSWAERDGEKVPESEDLKLSNDAVKLDAVVLYADIASSTEMVRKLAAQPAAELYKSFLYCAARIIRAEDGVVTAYDGDRVMGVFFKGAMNTNAARAALKINWARQELVVPGFKKIYSSSDYQVQHVTGIDRSKLFVARTGVRGANDLVWVGRAANRAAKLAALAPSHASRITADVYNSMLDEAKYSSDGKNMWEAATWDGVDIYRSTWRWAL